MPTQAFWTNSVKKRCVIVNAENFKNYLVLQECSPIQLLRAFIYWDTAFPLVHKGLNIRSHEIASFVSHYCPSQSYASL